MLTSSDIEFMKDAQDELYEFRVRPITLIYEVKQYDDVSGALIGTAEEGRTVDAVITELSINKANGARYLESGVEYEQGDIKIDVKIERIADVEGTLTKALFDDKRYEILGGDKKGIGVRNRIEYIGREIA